MKAEFQIPGCSGHLVLILVLVLGVERWLFPAA